MSGCPCPLCDKEKHQKAMVIAQDVILTKRLDAEDEINGTAFILAAATLAKAWGVTDVQFLQIAVKCFISVEPITREGSVH